MIILSIETSCDETAISIIEAKGNYKNTRFKVLANALASQAKLHARYGGVYPMLAKREHLKNLPVLLKKILKEIKPPQGRILRIQKGSTFSRFKNPGIDLIAVTYGPGLEPALWTGITFAQELAHKWKAPLAPVNHMEGHFFSAIISNPTSKQHPYKLEYVRMSSLKFPVLALLVSGGHTELVLSRKFLKYKIIGETLDDAAGEAFDKVARLLGLPYPGGPEISKLALKARTYKLEPNLKLPRPMIKSPDFNFSFSGLKTAALYLLRNLKNAGVKLDKKLKAGIAREFEDAVVEVLVAKTTAAARRYGVKTLIVAGGVAANKHLRESFKLKTYKFKNFKLMFPAPGLATDNSIMIALAGYFHRNDKKIPPDKIYANGNLRLSQNLL